MAVQTVDTVIIADPGNPVELQNYFTSHPLIAVTAIAIWQNVVYVVRV